MKNSEGRLVETLVHLADTLVKDFDILDLFFYLVEVAPDLVGADEAGLLLADEGGNLHVAAVTSESVRVIELLQIRNREGPCHDAYTSGDQVVSSLNEPRVREEWPSFVESALHAGFTYVAAMPMRLRATSLGGLNLFSREVQPMGHRQLMAAQALADIATISILQHRAAADSSVLVQGLQTALDSRIVIEQAKGVISQTLGVDVDQAFGLLRRYARDRNLSLRQTSESVVAGDLDSASLSSSR